MRQIAVLVVVLLASATLPAFAAKQAASDAAPQAALRLPNFLASHMVLQRDAPITIRGWGKAGEQVRVTLGNEKVSTKVNKDGQWELSLKPRKASAKPVELTVQSGDESLTLKDILIGEVWVCSGQSNMEFRLPHAENGKEEVAGAGFPQIRFLNVSGAYAAHPLDDVKGKWVACTPESAGEIYAVAYFFGRKIHQELDVPVGLLCPAMGATPARAWTSGKMLIEKNMYVNEVKQISDKETIEKATAKYSADMEEWQAAAEKAKAQGTKPPARPRGLPRIGARTPSALFNGMISPLTALRIRGVIWYQGENDVTGLPWYRPLFPNLIQSWRDAWGQGDLPFYHVQLPPYDYRHANSALLREVQMESLSMKNVGLAVTLDVGDFNDIHPPYKKQVGERLALWALAKDYGQKDLVYSGPIYKGMGVEGAAIRLSFDHVGSGLVAQDGELANFFIAGDDKQFVPAKATIEKDTVVVASDDVAKPVAVRYAFDNAGVPSLFNKEGLPASSFRTDRW